MPRINQVKKARKDQGKCGRCGAALPAGSAYQWIKFRYGGKHIRCMACHFRGSELTQSKLSGALAAMEGADDALPGASTMEEIKDVAECAAEQIEEVGEEYQESADAILCEFSESSVADDCQEKAEELSSWAEEIRYAVEGYENEYDPDEGYDSEAEWLESARDELQQALDNCPV